MEYERIHNVKMGVLSPTKLRVKLLGTQGCKKKEAGSSNSSRTSPSRIEEMKYAKNSLLDGHLDQQDLVPNVNLTANSLSSPISSSGVMVLNVSRNVSLRTQDDCNGYDSGHDNGSSSGFEFHRGHQQSSVGPHNRHVPSKWNEAEKWVVNRQMVNPNLLKRSNSQNHGNRQILPSWLRTAPAIAEQKYSVVQAVDTKRMVEKFPSVPYYLRSNSLSATETSGFTAAISTYGDSGNLQRGKNQNESSVVQNPVAESTASPAVQSVSMRDIGTEMTPIPSQEPSRTGTPNEATTPIRSPTSTRPSTPRKGEPTPSSQEVTAKGELNSWKSGCRVELSDRELQLKTRREIAALGIQLGKMNIASWASKEEVEHPSRSPVNIDAHQLVKMEYKTRAAAWEEAERSKHVARYKREEVSIQAWENHQKAKFEAEMKQIEAGADRMKARAKEKMLEKLAIMQRRVEEKQATAAARMNREAARTAQQAEHIRQTGGIAKSSCLPKCSCLF